jgi:hypothetical protein
VPGSPACDRIAANHAPIQRDPASSRCASSLVTRPGRSVYLSSRARIIACADSKFALAWRAKSDCRSVAAPRAGRPCVPSARRPRSRARPWWPAGRSPREARPWWPAGHPIPPRCLTSMSEFWTAIQDLWPTVSYCATTSSWTETSGHQRTTRHAEDRRRRVSGRPHDHAIPPVAPGCAG